MNKITIAFDGVSWTIDQFIDAYAYIRVPEYHNWVTDVGYDLRAFSIPVVVMRKNGHLCEGFLDQLDLTDVVAWRARDFTGEPRICDSCCDYCSENEIVDYDDGTSCCSFCDMESGE